MSGNFLKIDRWLRENLSEEMSDRLQAGEDLVVVYHHDHWCGIFQGLECDCKPDVLIEGEKILYPQDLI